MSYNKETHRKKQDLLSRAERRRVLYNEDDRSYNALRHLVFSMDPFAQVTLAYGHRTADVTVRVGPAWVNADIIEKTLEKRGWTIEEQKNNTSQLTTFVVQVQED